MKLNELKQKDKIKENFTIENRQDFVASDRYSSEIIGLMWKQLFKKKRFIMYGWWHYKIRCIVNRCEIQPRERT